MLAAQGSFEKYGRKSNRVQFLDAMSEVVPWSRLRTGHDLPPHQVQELCGRRSQAQEQDQVASQDQGRASVPDTEAHLRFRQGEIPGLEEESQPAMRLLRAGKPLSAPPAASPSGEVVCPGTAKRPPDTTKQLAISRNTHPISR
jgi:hypothetical protein